MNQKEYWRKLLKGQLRRFAWIALCLLAVFILPMIGVEHRLIRTALIITSVVLFLQVLADMWAIAFGEWCKEMGSGLGTLYGAIRGPKKGR